MHSKLDRNQISIIFFGDPIYMRQIHIFKFKKCFLIIPNHSFHLIPFHLKLCHLNQRNVIP